MKAISRLGLALVVIGAGLYCDPSCKEGFVIPRLLVLSYGAIVLWAGVLFSGGKLHKTAMDKAMVFMAAALIVTAAVSSDFWMSFLGPHQGQFHSVIPLVLCSLIFYGVAISDISMDEVRNYSILMACIASCYAIVQYLGFDKFLYWSIPNGRMTATFGTPIFLGASLGAVAPVAWSFIRRRKFIGIGSLALISTGLILAHARGGMAAGAAGILVYELLLKGYRKTSLLAVVAASVVFLIIPAHSESDASRVEVWKTSFSAFLHHPIFGYGPDTFLLAFRQYMTDGFLKVGNNEWMVQLNAHHDILQVAATMGIIGLLAYGYFVASAFGVSECCALSVLVALFVQAKVNDIPIWTLCMGGCFLAVAARREEYQSKMALPLSLAAFSVAIGIMVHFQYAVKAEKSDLIAEKLWRSGHLTDGVRFYSRAHKLQPHDFYYYDEKVGHLLGCITSYPKQAQGMLVSAMISESMEQERIHPKDPGVHEAVAVSLLYKTFVAEKMTQTSDIEREFRISSELAPTFMPMKKIRDRVYAFIHGGADNG